MLNVCYWNNYCWPQLTVLVLSTLFYAQLWWNTYSISVAFSSKVSVVTILSVLVPTNHSYTLFWNTENIKTSDTTPAMATSR